MAITKEKRLEHFNEKLRSKKTQISPANTVDNSGRSSGFPKVNPASHHVYLKSLIQPGIEDLYPYDLFAMRARSLLNRKFGSGRGTKQYDSIIKEAIDFLRACAANESISEKAYMAEVQKKMRDLGLESLAYFNDDFDYLDYIRKMNEAIVGLDEFKRRLEIEIGRNKNKRQPGKFYSDATISQYLESYVITNKKYADQLEEEKKKKSGNNNTNSNNKREYLKEKTGTFTEITREWLVKNIKGMDSLYQLATMAAIIQNKLIPILEQKASLFYKKNDQGEIETGYSKKEGEWVPVIDKKAVEAFMEQELRATLNNIRHSKNKIANEVTLEYLKHFNIEYKDIYKNVPKTVEELSKAERRSYENSKKLGIKYKMPTKKVKVGKTPFKVTFHEHSGAGAEVQDALAAFENKIVRAYTRATTGIKSDITIILGDLLFEENREEIADWEYNSRLKRDLSQQNINDMMDRYYRIADSKMFKNYSYKSTMLSQLYDEIDKKIKALKSTSQTFILHNNVKDYLSAAQGQTRQKSFEGFSLGSTGANLAETMNVIGEVSQYGNFNHMDVDMLTTLLLNCSKYAMGEGNEPYLKDYLSTFAVFFMFEDGAEIARQTALSQYNSSRKNLHVLHLFKANGIYFPASYILTIIADILEEQYDGFNSDMSGVVKITISGIDKGPDLYAKARELKKGAGGKTTIEMWDEVSATQMAATHIEMRVLKSFVNILDALNK